MQFKMRKHFPSTVNGRGIDVSSRHANSLDLDALRLVREGVAAGSSKP